MWRTRSICRNEAIIFKVMSRFPLLLSVAITLVCFSACHKDPASPVPVYKSRLLAGPWRMHIYDRFIRRNPSQVDTVNELAGMPSCESDNLYIFKGTDSSTNGDLIIDEGSSKCDPSMPQQRTPIWWNIPYSN